MGGQRGMRGARGGAAGRGRGGATPVGEIEITPGGDANDIMAALDQIASNELDMGKTFAGDEAFQAELAELDNLEFF